MIPALPAGDLTASDPPSPSNASATSSAPQYLAMWAESSPFQLTTPSSVWRTKVGRQKASTRGPVTQGGPVCARVLARRIWMCLRDFVVEMNGVVCASSLSPKCHHYSHDLSKKQGIYNLPDRPRKDCTRARGLPAPIRSPICDEALTDVSPTGLTDAFPQHPRPPRPPPASGVDSRRVRPAHRATLGASRAVARASRTVSCGAFERRAPIHRS